MGRNYLLAHIRKDSAQTVVFGLCFAAIGAGTFVIAAWKDSSLQAAGIAAILCGAFAVYVGRNAWTPQNDPTVQAFAQYGDVPAVLAEIQREYATGKPLRLGRLTLLDNWLTATGVGITVIRLEDLVAAGLLEVKLHSGGVNIGSNRRIVAQTKDGASAEFNCRNRDIAETLISLLAERCPRAQCDKEPKP